MWGDWEEVGWWVEMGVQWKCLRTYVLCSLSISSHLDITFELIVPFYLERA